MFSLFSRFFPRKEKQSSPSPVPSNYHLFREIALECNGEFIPDFKLFLYDTTTPIDLLLFMPHRGLYYGEKISWRFDELKEASVQRASASAKKNPTTRFNAVETALRQKLAAVLSFDSTPCERFIWLENLKKDEFEQLDPSFHELLPEARLIFADDTPLSARSKLENLAPFQPEPFSQTKIFGSLSAHTLLLPAQGSPFGIFLSEEQMLFLKTEFANTLTTLYGSSGGGKSTLILRKALMLVLQNPGSKVLIVTPTLLAGELLRNKLVSLLDYGALKIPFDSILFSTPQASIPLEKIKFYDDVIAVFCDDAYRMEESYIAMLKERRGDRWLLLSTALEPDTLENTFFLLNRYRGLKETFSLEAASKNGALYVLIGELRKCLPETDKHDIMIIVPESELLQPYKNALDEYFGLNCRILDSQFSLQYRNLDNVLLTTPDQCSGLRIPHLFLILPSGAEDYTFELSRASDTATIISFPNPDGGNDAKDHQE